MSTPTIFPATNQAAKPRQSASPGTPLTDAVPEAAPEHRTRRSSLLPGDQRSPDAHSTCVAGNHDARLAFAAASLDDVERTRIAMANRVGALEREGLDGSPMHQQAVALLTALELVEHQAVLGLRRALRAHPLGAWVAATVGVGEKQGARLIAAIGDPAYNHAEGRPRRGPAELWAYCGYAPGQKRRRGLVSNWNVDAKMRAFLVAQSCMKSPGSPYRAVYLQARANWLLTRPDATLGHSHNHGLRLAAKAVLRDLFLAASA